MNKFQTKTLKTHKKFMGLSYKHSLEEKNNKRLLKENKKLISNQRRLISDNQRLREELE